MGRDKEFLSEFSVLNLGAGLFFDQSYCRCFVNAVILVLSQLEISPSGNCGIRLGSYGLPSPSFLMKRHILQELQRRHNWGSFMGDLRRSGSH